MREGRACPAIMTHRALRRMALFYCDGTIDLVAHTPQPGNFLSGEHFELRFLRIPRRNQLPEICGLLGLPRAFWIGKSHIKSSSSSRRHRGPPIFSSLLDQSVTTSLAVEVSSGAIPAAHW
jgi:hypothetical protein